MNLDWAAIGSWLSLGATLLIGAFVYGKLTQRVSDVVDDVREVKSDVREIKETQADHSEEIVRIKTHLKLHDR